MTKRFSLKLLAIAALAIVVAGGVVLWLARGEQAQQAQQQPAAKPSLTVTVARPAQTRLSMTLAANGNIAAWQEASIGSESNGLRLAEVLVNVGDTVRAGQVLATFAGESVEAEVAQVRAGLLEAEAHAAEAAVNAARARTLQATGALSEQQINQYLTA